MFCEEQLSAARRHRGLSISQGGHHGRGWPSANAAKDRGDDTQGRTEGVLKSIGEEARTILRLGPEFLLGAFTAVVGFHDVFSPRTAERATGIVFLFSGLILTASTILIARVEKDYGAQPAPWARESQYSDDKVRNDKARDLALGGLVLGLIPGVTLIFIQFSSYGYNDRAALWVLAAAIPALGAVMLWNEGARLDFFRAASSVALIAAGITLLPALLGSAFKPDVDATNVDAQMSMEVVGRRQASKLGNVAVIACQLTIKNIGKRRLVFVGFRVLRPRS